MTISDDLSAQTDGTHAMSNNAQTSHQGDELGPVFVTDGGEAEPHALALFGVEHGRLGANGAFLHQEVQVGGGTDALGLFCLYEHTANAEISNASYVIAAIASPVDPDMLAGNDAARHSTS
jgi:hypothetical protein